MAIIKINIFFKYTQKFKALGVSDLMIKSIKTGKTKAKEVEQKAPISEINKCNFGTNIAIPTGNWKVKLEILLSEVISLKGH